jgi:hypothetical protein
MIDPEVARLRRLRDEALRVREIARTLGALPWATNDALLARAAGAGWRIARIVSGKLIAHPYLRYQKGAGVGSLVGNRLAAGYLRLRCKDRSRGLKAFEAQLQSLSRQLEDVRALTRSTEFSDNLGRSQGEIKSLIHTLAGETGAETLTEETLSEVTLTARLPVRPVRVDGTACADRLVGELAQSFEGDWPYLAF